MSEDMLVLRGRRRRGEDGFRVFSIRIPEEVARELDRLSDESGHSRNELIGTLLEYAARHCVVEN